MSNVKIKDIAEKLGISSATVSMALNDRPGVNAQTKQRVMELVKKLNYTGSTIKKIPQNNGVINFLVYKRFGKIITNTQFFSDLIEAVEKATRYHNYTIALTYCNNQEELNSVINSILSAQPEGIIILGTEMEENDLNVFENMDIPIIVLDNDLLGCEVDTVTINNFDGIFRAIKYLKEQGHTDIGYLKSSFLIKNFEQRSMAFKYSLDKLNLNYDENKVFLIEPTIEGACKDIHSIIKEKIVFPKALIADNDLIAIGALKAFNQVGIRVPDDISIIGFDNIPMGGIFEPSLTSINVSCKDLGSLAVEQLLWRIKHKNEPFHKTSIATSLVIRRSVKSQI